MAAMTLAEVETAINALLTDPQVDYTIGDKTVKASQKLEQLMKYRDHLLENPSAEVAFVNFEMDYDEFGVSQAELHD